MTGCNSPIQIPDEPRNCKVYGVGDVVINCDVIYISTADINTASIYDERKWSRVDPLSFFGYVMTEPNPPPDDSHLVCEPSKRTRKILI